jgi:type IV pilus assembly protein PilA
MESEEGFTLMELIIVVLILGILMAIAIPTFLNLATGAKTNSAEADLTTATVDESTYLASWGDFDGSTSTTYPLDNVSASASPPGMSSLDPGLKWISTATAQPYGTTSVAALPNTAGTKTIYVGTYAATGAAAIVLGTAGQGGKYYWVYDNSGALSYDSDTSTSTTTVPQPAAPTTGALWGTSWASASSY